MDCCKHCNFRNTPKCELFGITEQLENGEITEDFAQARYEEVLQKCDNDYYDHQIFEGDVRNDK